MIITKKTIQKKVGKSWQDDSIIDSNVVNILLNDDIIAKYIMHSNMIRSIKYHYGKIIIDYGNGYRAIYE